MSILCVRFGMFLLLFLQRFPVPFSLSFWELHYEYVASFGISHCSLRLYFYSFLSQFLGLYILNWRILRFTVFFFSSASLNLLFIHFSEFYTLYIWFIYLCPGIKLLEVYCTQGKSGSLRRAPPLRPRRRFLCKMKAISKQWKACAFRKWAKQRWAVRKHHLLLGAGQDCGGPV